MIGKLIRTVLILTVLSLIGAYVALVFLYQVKDSGTLYLPNARGVASITREKDTHIAHIRGTTREAAMYA